MPVTPHPFDSSPSNPLADAGAGLGVNGGSERARRMLGEVAAGLARRPKELPAKYFYDARGSRLFEAITRLPEYYLTRAEYALLQARLPELAARCRSRTVIELGAGSATKARLILGALRGEGGAEAYQPIDLSADALADAVARLRLEYPGLRVEPVVADFSHELPPATALPAPRLFAFLGSTIGNLEPAAATRLLSRVRAVLGPDDHLLLGVDLKKDVEQLEAAYNDAAGVTAEFNLNVLLVLNRGLGAEFVPGNFVHHAFYNEAESRIEMHLVSVIRQRIAIPGLGNVSLEPGETIRTEISCKYDRPQVEALLTTAGFTMESWWPDDGEQFALVLAAPR